MNNPAPVANDPYDPWMTRLGIWCRKLFYRGNLFGKLLAAAIVAMDWLCPTILRRLIGCKSKPYPITTAQWILSQDRVHDPQKLLDALLAEAVPDKQYGMAWGLGFPWMSKNGLYAESIPFITHTPYAMEALLKLCDYPETRAQAKQAFEESWQFLESLHTMNKSENTLALSYAPLEEPRIVVNANAYAALAFALHSVHGANRELSKQRAIQTARWVVQQQRSDGSWMYYADNEAGNFIDCFHSCFVLKNLIKAGKHIPEIQQLCASNISAGRQFLDREFFDTDKGLARRFLLRDIVDPYVWDLYDQAEYIGLLVAMGDLPEANNLARRCEEVFLHNGQWYCRIDFLGRRWGKNFLRWGIMPFHYNNHLLEKALAEVN